MKGILFVVLRYEPPSQASPDIAGTSIRSKHIVLRLLSGIYFFISEYLCLSKKALYLLAKKMI
jgi:hypothetical protein